jgi:hypothetical protein
MLQCSFEMFEFHDDGKTHASFELLDVIEKASVFYIMYIFIEFEFFGSQEAVRI